MFVRILVAGLLALGMGRAAVAADLAAYGRLPSIEAASLSPNGKLVAVIHPDGDKRGIIISDIDTHKVVLAINGGTNRVSGLRWADDDTLILLVSRTTFIRDVNSADTQYSTAEVFSISKKRQSSLIQAGERNPKQDPNLNIIEGRTVVRTEGGHTIAYVQGVSFVNGYGKPTLYRTDITTGTTHVEYKGAEGMTGLLVGPDGHILVRKSHDDHTDHSSLDFKAENGFTPSPPLPGIEPDFNPTGLSADGKSVLIFYKKDKAYHTAQAPIDGGAWQPFEGVGETDELLFDGYTDRLMAVVSDQGDKVVYRFTDPVDQAFWNGIAKAFAGQRVTLADFTPDRRRVLIRVDSPARGQSYYVIDHASGQATLVGDVYAGLGPADVSPVRPVHYTAADGLKIDGFLTLPRGVGDTPKGLPLVVLPHDTPDGHDNADFDWFSQALAAQGYAVLRANFRGSDNVGLAFHEAGYGEWGKKMQTDLSDGVRSLAGQGVIDPKRVCIVGSIYGGYAALAGAALDRTTYRCAVSIDGDADLSKTIYVPGKYRGETTFRYWTKFYGVSGPTDPKLEAISPIHHAADVSIPVLIMQRKFDGPVIFNQATSMAEALKKAGKPYEAVTLDSLEYWTSTNATRLKTLQNIVDFLKKNNPP